MTTNITYYVGSQPHITVTFLDANGNLVDPTDVVLNVWDPAGNVTLYASTFRVSVGNYYQDVPVSLAGIYTYAWQGSGAATAVIQGTFTVAPTLLTGTNPSPLDLTTVANIKEEFGYANASSGINLASQDRTLQRLITSCSQWMLSRMNRSGWAQVTVNERRNGNGNTQMCLKNWPVVSVNSIAINNQVVQPSSDGVTGGWTTDGYSVFLIGCMGIGYFGEWNAGGLCGAVFSYGKQNITINYTHGLTDAGGNLLADVAQACIDFVLYKFQRNAAGIHLKSLIAAPGQSTSYQIKEAPDEVMGVVNRYKLVPIAEW